MQGGRKIRDRRADRRYEVKLDVRWKVVHRKRVRQTGTGITIDVSSGGISFNTDEPLSVGHKIELSIAWPALLGGTAPLRLVVEGRVVRATGRRVAVGIQRYEFRTAPRSGSDSIIRTG